MDLAREVVLLGRGLVGLDVGRDKLVGLEYYGVGVHRVNEFLQVAVVKLLVFVVHEDEAHHRQVGNPLGACAVGVVVAEVRAVGQDRVVDGRVHVLARLVLARVAEGGIVVPRHHAKRAALFEQVVVVRGRADVGVDAVDEGAAGPVAAELIDVDGRIHVLEGVERLERAYHAHLVFFGYVALGARAKHDGVARGIVVDVLELDVDGRAEGALVARRAAAVARVVGLVDLAEVGRGADGTLQEAVLDALESHVKADILAVYRDVGEARERRRHVKLVEDVVAHVVAHEGAVHRHVVENELVEAVVVNVFIIVVELDGEREAVRARAVDRGERGVALGAHADVFEGLAVDRDIRGVVLLVEGVLDEALPVSVGELDADFVDVAIVEDAVLVADVAVDGHDAKRLAVHEQDCDAQGQKARERADETDNF